MAALIGHSGWGWDFTAELPALCRCLDTLAVMCGLHPVLTASAVATVALFSVLIFREPFHWTTGAGILLVIAGVALITVRVA
jgi:multidrug transporter EmrE-like cation transporter